GRLIARILIRATVPLGPTFPTMPPRESWLAALFRQTLPPFLRWHPWDTPALSARSASAEPLPHVERSAARSDHRRSAAADAPQRRPAGLGKGQSAAVHHLGNQSGHQPGSIALQQDSENGQFVVVRLAAGGELH